MSEQNVSNYVAFAKGYREGRKVDRERREIARLQCFPSYPYDKGLLAGAEMTNLKEMTNCPSSATGQRIESALMRLLELGYNLHGSAAVKLQTDKLEKKLDEETSKLTTARYKLRVHMGYRFPMM